MIFLGHHDSAGQKLSLPRRLFVPGLIAVALLAILAAALSTRTSGLPCSVLHACVTTLARSQPSRRNERRTACSPDFASRTAAV